MDEFRRVLSRGGFLYLGSPYTLYEDGIDRAAEDVAKVAAALYREGITVFSPIVHSHHIAKAGGLDPLDADMWLKHCHPFMEAARGLIIAELHGWQESRGLMDVELPYFEREGKPVFSYRLPKRPPEFSL